MGEITVEHLYEMVVEKWKNERERDELYQREKKQKLVSLFQQGQVSVLKPQRTEIRQKAIELGNLLI